MKSFLIGFLLSTCVCTAVYKHLLDKDFQILLQQNDLLQQQQEIILSIEIDCMERNWLSFDNEIYICMHVNKMFNQLSEPPMPYFEFPLENDA